MEELVLAMGILKLARESIPIIQEQFKKGNITVDQQKAVLAAYNALIDAGETAFSGPEWDIEPD